MADLNANINVGIETTQALNQLKALQKQISQFHQSVARSSGEAAVAQRDLQRNFLNSVNSIQGFSAELRTVRTTAESFTNSLEKNKFSMREYFRYSAGATKTFGKSFVAEMATIERTAIERVKTLQTQYIKMGRDAQGAMQAIAIRPTTLNMQDLGTKTAIAGQKQALFNQLVKQGSTNLLNFGKNTQWAGRQLMVGFTLPLGTLGMVAGRVFFDMEKAAIKFKKVYGDLFTAPEETKKAMESIVELGQAYAAYGIAVSDSLSIAADAAAAGFAGVDLQNQTSAALKLSVLGQLDLQKALETTISLQNAFQLSSADLAGEIDFLNAVENQTVVSLDDITEAVPRVAPVIKQLGGDVRDLAFFLAAMKEGGINAAQGANALKSGLASLINPSEKSAGILNTLGINIKSIVEGNQGNIAATVTSFAKALEDLDPLRRAQAIEQLFGKFQFARISALFDNITRDGTQAQRVLELAGSTVEELANLSEAELGVSAASSMNKFRKAIEQIKVALVPIGELFVQIATPFVEFGTEMLKAFNKLPDGVKTVIGSVITILGGIGPVALMAFGLINNGIANMIKFFATVRMGYLKITGQAKGIADETQYMTQEQLEAAAAAASLDQAHAGLTQRFTAEKVAVDQLRTAYEAAAAAGLKFTLNNPGMIKPGFNITQAQGFAKGGVISGPGSGTSDSIPAMVSNGEAIIPAKQTKKYAPIIEAMIAGKIPGFKFGLNPLSSIMGNARVGTRMSGQSFIDSLRSGKTNYQSGFATGTGEDFLGQYGTPKRGQTSLRGRLEQSFLGMSSKTGPSQRPTFGFATSSALQRILNMAMFGKVGARASGAMNPLSKSLDRYGDISLITNKGVANRSTMYAGDSLLDFSRSGRLGPPAPMTGATGAQLSSAKFGRFSQPFGTSQTGPNRFSTNPKPPYIETQTPGGFSFSEIEKIVTADAALASQLRTELVSAGFPNIKVGSPGFVQKMMTSLGVPGFAKGGLISGPGTGKSDSIPAMVSNGEAIIPAAMAKKYGPLIEQMIAGNIPGYMAGKVGLPGATNVASKFTGRQMNIPGGAELGHFSKASEASASELLRLATEAGATAKELEKISTMIASTGPDKKIKIFDSSVERVSRELNQMVGDAGSGKTAPASLVKRDLVDRGRDARMPIMDRMQKQGVSSVDAMAKADKITEEIRIRMKDIGDEVLLTAEDINRITQEAYEAVAASDKQVEAAYQEMKKFQTYTDPTTERGAQGQRESFGTGFIKQRERIKKNATGFGADAYRPGAFKTTQEMENVSGLSSEEIQTLFKSLTDQQKVEVYEELKKGSAAFISSLIRNSGKAILDGVDSATATDAVSIAPAAQGLVNSVRSEVEAGLNNASGAQSPSVEIAKATQNMVDGVEQTLLNSKDDVAKATEQMIGPVTQATKASVSGSSFGNINTKEPVPAARNAPRQVVQAMSQETTAARTFAGDLKTSFASARTNITREMGFVKEEFGSIVQQIKQKFGKGGQEIVAVAQQTNQGLVVNGKQYGFNAIAQAQGRDGAIEAVVTRKNAEIISKVTAAYNSGVRQIPAIIPAEMSKAAKAIQASGERFKRISVDNEIKRQKAIQAVQQMMPSQVVKPGQKGFIGPMPQSGLNKFGQGFDSASQGLSNFAFGLSAVSGVLSLMGGPLQGFAQAITMLSSGMFALTQILAAVRTLELKSLALKIQALIVERTALALEKTKAVTTLAATLGTGAFATSIWAAVAGVVAFLGPFLAIGLAVAAVAGTFILVNHLLAENQKKINGLGDAAFATGEKLKNIANLAGFEPTRQVDRGTQLAAVEGIDAAGTARAASIRESAEFQDLKDKETAQGGFKNDIAAIRDADPADAQAALDSLALQLLSLAPEGTDPKKIQEYVAAIAMEAGKEDLDLSFVLSVDLSDPAAFDQIVQKSNTTLTELQAVSSRGESALKAYGSEASATYEALNTGLVNGVLTTEQYTAQTNELLSGISTLGADATMVLDKMFANVGIEKETVDGIDNLDARVAILKAAMAGVTGLEDIAKDLEESNGDAVEQQRILTTLEGKRAAAVLETSEAQERLNQVVKEADNKAQATALDDYLEKAREEAALKAELEKEGYSAADAQLILTNEMLKGARAAAIANGTYEEFKNQLAEFKEIEGAKVGGGTRSNPIQDAIDGLKKQRQEIINTSKAYGALRKSGMNAEKAMRFAQNPDLLSALNAGLKVNSKQWDEIIKRIKATEAATRKWRKSTVQGQTEVYMETFDKVSNLFSLEEEKLQAAFDKATSADNALIQSLENQVKGLNDQITTYSNDLDGIAEKEDKINSAYDKKVKALEQTKKINDDILRQQKSQLSIADALSQGDIAAAASAMQQARSENAASALEAQGNQLELGRQAQLSGVKSAGGFTRVQIEEKISRLKKQISVIELGSLKAAQNRVTAAEQELDKNTQNLRVGGLTKIEWTNQAAGIDAAAARATLYKAEVNKALGSVKNILKEWQKLDGKVVTTTHNVVKKENGQANGSQTAGNSFRGQRPGPENPGTTPGQVGPGGKFMWDGDQWNRLAKGGFVSGMGTATSDSIPALLSNGEYVIKAASVNKFGKGFLDKINSGVVPNFKMRYANGGMVGVPSLGLSNGFSLPTYATMSEPSETKNISSSLYANTNVSELSTQVDNSVYNYNLNVNVEGTDASPDQIANVVMRKLQDFRSQRVRGQVVR